MKQQELNQNWKMRSLSEEEHRKAVVPGSVYQDLILNGEMEDPYYRDNEMKALERMKEEYEYIATFSIEKEIWESKEIVLHFDGLDTLADIYLNGTHLGFANNMHRIWEYSVKQYVKQADNLLKIIFHSPTKFIEEAYKNDPMNGTPDAMVGFPLIRKAHCMFGWDWGPRLPDAGIWRKAMLCGYNELRIDSVYITQDHTEKEVILHFQLDCLKTTEDNQKIRFEKAKKGLEDFHYTVTLTDPDGKTTKIEGSPSTCSVKDPQIWWPNGYGKQPLYTVNVELFNGDVLEDSWEKKIGLRTMTISREEDEFGESFAHVVNGVKIFAMGADYIPEDNILSRVTPERTYHLLKQCKDANFNCIRVWGGGNYPYDAFWDACDELGLVVWQDFMFACAVYHLTEEFEENIKAEFIDNIKRIRSHPSLGLWCGNNEMEMFTKSEEYSKSALVKSDYIKMYEYIIPKILKEYDPNTFYWPASPSSGGNFDEPNDEKRGDVHYWDVWHGNKPFSEYRKFQFRYVSEFGFQSFPSLKTIETFTEPEDRNVFSYVMEKHQRNNSANGKIMNYMEQTFLYPNDFDTTLYASQLLQAEAIRYGVEHFRRIRGCCMGAVYWQLNDCWPVASWASIDYCNRWKALHYAAKRFFAPIMISCKEEGVMTQDLNVNAEPFELKKSIALCVANETLNDETLTVQWAFRNRYAEILQSGNQILKVDSLSSKWLEEVNFPNAEIREEYVSFELIKEGTIISQGTVLFTVPKYFKFVDPELTCTVEGDELLIGAKSYARGIEIKNGEDDLLLEDNYFDMNAGERRVKILAGVPEEIKIRSVYHIR